MLQLLNAATRPADRVHIADVLMAVAHANGALLDVIVAMCRAEVEVRVGMCVQAPVCMCVEVCVCVCAWFSFFILTSLRFSLHQQATSDPNTLFRGNSIASKALDEFMKVQHIAHTGQRVTKLHLLVWFDVLPFLCCFNDTRPPLLFLPPLSLLSFPSPLPFRSMGQIVTVQQGRYLQHALAMPIQTIYDTKAACELDPTRITASDPVVRAT